MVEENSRKQEGLLYAVIWLFVAILPLIIELWDYPESSFFDWKHVFRAWIGMIPLLLLFIVHNHYLLPSLLKKGKILPYILLLLAMLVLYSGAHYIAEDFFHDRGKESAVHHHPRPSHPRPPHRPFPFPLMFHMVFAILAVGMNLTIYILSEYRREQANRIDLENYRLREELKYLKQQISPHFFMNVLNNIHEMAEEDVVKAQDMILELSRLMRYVLYESENDTTTLSAECRFISSYVDLMRRRYPENAVKVVLDLPASVTDDVRIPPLLFISFIENAFKHGVTYMSDTHIHIRLCETDDRIQFSCTNTIPKTRQHSEGGLGLMNVRRRLELLYGDSYSMQIEEDGEHYSVTLLIPRI